MCAYVCVCVLEALSPDGGIEQNGCTDKYACGAAVYCRGYGLSRAVVPLQCSGLENVAMFSVAVQFERLSSGLHDMRTGTVQEARIEPADATSLSNYPPLPAKNSIPVTMCDLGRLTPGEFLNDSVVDYFISILKDSLSNGSLHLNLCFAVRRTPYFASPRLLARGCPRGFFDADIAAPPIPGRERRLQSDHTAHMPKLVHVFGSFFYTRLQEGATMNCSRAYDNVKSWAQGMNIFNKDFLFIPINQNVHWSLAIICNPGTFATPYVRESDLCSSAVTANWGPGVPGEHICVVCDSQLCGNGGIFEDNCPSQNAGGQEHRCCRDRVHAHSVDHSRRGPVDTTSAGNELVSLRCANPFHAADCYANSRKCTTKEHARYVAPQCANSVVERSPTCQNPRNVLDPWCLRCLARRLTGYYRRHGHKMEPVLCFNAALHVAMNHGANRIEHVVERNLQLAHNVGFKEASVAVFASREKNRERMRRPCVFLLDSLKAHSTQSIVKHLRGYLQNCWDTRTVFTNEVMTICCKRKFNARSVPAFKVDVPQQQNSCDCGIFIMLFVEQFLRQIPLLCPNSCKTINFSSVISRFKTNLYTCGKKWFHSQNAFSMRCKLAHVLLSSRCQ